MKPHETILLHGLQRPGQIGCLAAGVPRQFLKRYRMRRRDRREQGAFLCDSTLAKLSVEVNHTLGSPGLSMSL